MRPLTLDDLLPLEDFASRRAEFFEAHARYLDRCRRVRVGPRVTLVFENRQTLWFRAQDLLRVVRLADSAHVQRELDLFNRLLPSRDCLQAALLLALDDARLTDELRAWQRLRGESLRFRLGDKTIPAALETCRPEDQAISTAHWVRFELDAACRQLLANFSLPAHVEVAHEGYSHRSPPLSEEVRQSLLDDLELSDRDAVSSA
jgi:hypothetical protein